MNASTLTSEGNLSALKRVCASLSPRGPGFIDPILETGALNLTKSEALVVETLFEAFPHAGTVTVQGRTRIAYVRVGGAALLRILADKMVDDAAPGAHQGITEEMTRLRVARSLQEKIDKTFPIRPYPKQFTHDNWNGTTEVIEMLNKAVDLLVRRGMTPEKAAVRVEDLYQPGHTTSAWDLVKD